MTTGPSDDESMREAARMFADFTAWDTEQGGLECDYAEKHGQYNDAAAEAEATTALFLKCHNPECNKAFMYVLPALVCDNCLRRLHQPASVFTCPGCDYKHIPACTMIEREVRLEATS